MVPWSVKEVLSNHQEPIMSLITVATFNTILAVAVVAALAFACRIPYRLDRLDRPKGLLAERRERKHPQPADERYAA
jgi:hypothetical protein